MSDTISTLPYTRDILRLAAAVPGRVAFGELRDATELRSRTCGSRAAVAVELDGAGRVAAFSQAVEACAYGQAAAALMGARAIGLTLAEAEAQRAAVEAWLAGGAMPDWLAPLAPALDRTGRHQAILLPFRALVAAMRKAAA